MTAYLAHPDTARPLPAVLVGMELFGLSAHVRDVCERLAGLGYLALAPDLYHRSAPGIELPENTDGRAQGFQLLHRLTRQQALDDVAAARTWLQDRGSQVAGMVGLSVGGHVAYLAATALNLPAVAVIYGGWITSTEIPLSQPEPTLNRTPTITGRVLLVVGEDDTLIPAEQRRQLDAALTEAGVRHELVTYPDAAHGFLSQRRASYNPAAAGDTWQRLRQLFTSYE